MPRSTTSCATIPVDQINVNRPWIKKLMGDKKPYVGGLQYVVEQLRYSNDSNFQSYFGDTQVTYNRKRTLQQAKFTWGAFHDGFGLNEDELAQNGIVMTDDKSSVPTDAEKVQLTNLLQENAETLKLGFQENFDYMLHRDGSQAATDIPGLDALISTTPTVSLVVGGLDQSIYTWWQNNCDHRHQHGDRGQPDTADGNRMARLHTLRRVHPRPYPLRRGIPRCLPYRLEEHRSSAMCSSRTA